MSEKRQRTKANVVRIEDKAILGDYSIVVTDETYDLQYQSPGAKAPQQIGHYRSLSNLLKDVVKYRFNEKFNETTMTVKEYIDRYEKIHQNIENYIKKA